MNLKDKIKKEYDQKVTKPNNFDEVANKVYLKNNHHYLYKGFKISLISLSSLLGVFVLVIAAAIFMPAIQYKNTTKSVKKARFSVYDTNLVMKDTFQALNQIKYSENLDRYREVSDDFTNAVNTFAYNTFNQFDTNINLVYSPLMLYTQMDLISLASSDIETTNQFNNALNMSNQEDRGNNVYNAMKNNFFVYSFLNSTVQTKNSVFIQYDLGANPTFVNELTKRNAEAYTVNFHDDKDVNKILQWASQSVNEDNFLTKDDLEIRDDSALLFMSSLYFDNTWRSKYKTNDTKVDKFYLDENNSTEVKFMNHVYYGNIYDYDKYISVYDYYSSNDLTIQYLVPKDIKDNIFDLIDSNFLIEDETKGKKTTISLSLPKFKFTSYNKLNDVVKGVGITNPYVEYSNHLANAFINPQAMEYSYLYYTKQKTTISFDEDGTVAKSITFSMGAGATSSAPGPDNSYDIYLNQPFIYCVRDRSGLPLLLGILTNPNNQ